MLGESKTSFPGLKFAEFEPGRCYHASYDSFDKVVLQKELEGLRQTLMEKERAHDRQICLLKQIIDKKDYKLEKAMERCEALQQTLTKLEVENQTLLERVGDLPSLLVRPRGLKEQQIDKAPKAPKAPMEIKEIPSKELQELQELQELPLRRLVEENQRLRQRMSDLEWTTQNEAASDTVSSSLSERKCIWQKASDWLLDRYDVGHIPKNGIVNLRDIKTGGKTSGSLSHRESPSLFTSIVTLMRTRRSQMTGSDLFDMFLSSLLRS